MLAINALLFGLGNAARLDDLKVDLSQMKDPVSWATMEVIRRRQENLCEMSEMSEWYNDQRPREGYPVDTSRAPVGCKTCLEACYAESYSSTHDGLGLDEELNFNTCCIACAATDFDPICTMDEWGSIQTQGAPDLSTVDYEDPNIYDHMTGVSDGCGVCITSCSEHTLYPVVKKAKAATSISAELQDEFEEGVQSFTTCMFCCSGHELQNVDGYADGWKTCNQVFGATVDFGEGAFGERPEKPEESVEEPQDNDGNFKNFVEEPEDNDGNSKNSKVVMIILIVAAFAVVLLVITIVYARKDKQGAHGGATYEGATSNVKTRATQGVRGARVMHKCMKGLQKITGEDSV